MTFAQDAGSGELRRKPERWYGRVEPEIPWDPERWDRAERQVLVPHDLGLADIYRLLHPDGDDRSWVWRGAGREVGRRFDHVLASLSLQPQSMDYRHEWREPSPAAPVEPVPEFDPGDQRRARRCGAAAHPAAFDGPIDARARAARADPLWRIERLPGGRIRTASGKST